MCSRDQILKPFLSAQQVTHGSLSVEHKSNNWSVPCQIKSSISYKFNRKLLRCCCMKHKLVVILGYYETLHYAWTKTNLAGFVLKLYHVFKIKLKFTKTKPCTKLRQYFTTEQWINLKDWFCGDASFCS